MKQGVVVWVTGLPSAGKSTLAQAVFEELETRNVPACVLDGDAVRKALFSKVGYSDGDRDELYGSLARMGVLLAEQGLVVLVAATAHRRSFREECRKIAPAFLEVFVDTPLEVCRQRDSKGLYEASDKGRSLGVPGADVAYERPLGPDIVAQNGMDRTAIADTVRGILDVRVTTRAR
jgi:adenylyl-sulfate kinase